MSRRVLKKRQSKRGTKRNRVMMGLIIVALMSAVLLFFVGRFGYIATSGHIGQVDLTAKAQQKYRQKQVIKAKRGTIYDSTGNAIAEDSNVYTIYAVLNKTQLSATGKPLYVKDKEKTAKILAKYLALKESKILAYLNQNSFQVEFGSAGNNLTLETKKKIESENLPGIKFDEIASRLYLNGTFASHVVGLAQLTDVKDKTTGAKTSKLKGIIGIEKYFDSTLAGTDGQQTAKQDSYGYELPDTQVTTKSAVNGSDVYLTLDTRLQSYLEQLMQSVQDKYEPVKMNAVLMNSKTGKILAASQRPTFNASTKSGLTDFWRDSLVEDTYEPGSVFKLLTIASSIDSGNYTPNATYQSGSVTVGGATIRDWNRSGWGQIPYSQIIPRSSNTGAVALERQMGSATWKKYLKRFKFGEKTGITLPGEVKGAIQLGTELDRVSTSFGQSVQVNTMQMMSYLSAIANNGKMLQPQIVDKIVSATGKTKKTATKILANPISASTAKQVRSIMTEVVEQKYGTGQYYKIAGYQNQIAVKTGTAQIAGSDGQYLTGDSNYIFSVAGMAPADDPEYILYITLQQPKKMTILPEKMIAEIFNPLMKRALSYRTTSSNINENSIKMPSLVGQTITAATKEATDDSLKVVQVGKGSKVVQQLPVADDKVISGQRVVLLTEGAMTMPNIVGWSKNDVLKLAEITGRKFKLSGSGYVTSQSLAAGSVLPSSGTVKVKLVKP